MIGNCLCLLVLLQLFSIYSGQRVAPGVPPQHYQQQHIPQHAQMQQQHVPNMQVNQPHMQQQMHQVPNQQQQMHQVPVQQQQQQQQQQMHHVPVQQAPVQQQVPVQQAHHGHHGQPHGQLLNTANIAHEKEHIAEHMEVPMDTSKMSEQELQFHYFKMHDADNNNKLDGCELIKSLIHWHGPNDEYRTVQTDADLSEVVDPLLQSMDKNLDGYVDWPEFKTEMDI